MEETNPMMEQGTGMAFVTIFDGNSNPIIDKGNNLPIGMLTTSFTYEYDEEDGDKAEINIETDNEDLLDQPEFGDKMPLVLQWGHVLPTGKIIASPIRKVFIRDVEWEGGPSGVRVTIKCSCLLSILKNQPATRGDDSFEKWLTHVLIGIPETQLIDYKVRDRLTIGKTDYLTPVK